MNVALKFTPESAKQLSLLKDSPSDQVAYRAVLKCLGYMETNLRHHSLQTHEFTSMKGPKGEKVFESYAQNNTPGAFRVFWYYGPKKGELTIAAILKHP